MRSFFKSIMGIAGVILLAAAACGLSLGTYTLYQNHQNEETRNAFFQASPDEADILLSISNHEDLLFDMEAYKKFETSCLGNTNSNLLASGIYAKKGNIVCTSGDGTTVTIDGQEKKISDHPSSYLNVINESVFYRDDTDRKIYRYFINDGTTECAVNANCGETIVSVKGVYYIDYSTKKLFFLAFSDKEPKLFFSKRISSFAVVGNSAFVLTEDNTFGFLRESGSFTPISTEVDRFFFDGSAHIQKGSNIYRIDSFTQSECVAEDTDGVLIYEGSGYLYIAEKDSITRLLDNGDTEKICSLEENEIVKTMIETGSAYEIRLFVEKDGLLKEKNLLLEK